MSLIIENGILEEYIPPETDVVIPDGVTSIGNWAFKCRGGLRSIRIPYGVTSIGCGAFFECESLQSITIPDSVTSIDNSTFAGCTSIQSITIPNSITSIGDRVFEGCTSLQSVTLPYGVKRIEEKTFLNCVCLVKIVFRTKDFQVSVDLNAGYGFSDDKKRSRLERFYNDPTLGKFNKLKETCLKNPIALLRFFGHNEDEYRGYIKRNVVEIACSSIDEKQYKLINMILTAGFVTKNNIDKLINHSAERKQTEITALLMEYKNKHFGFTDINKRFRL